MHDTGGRPCPTASTPAAGTDMLKLIRLDSPHQPLPVIDFEMKRTRMPGNRTSHLPWPTSADRTTHPVGQVEAFVRQLGRSDSEGPDTLIT